MTSRHPLIGSAPDVSVRCGATLWAEVTSHVHQADGDEHGGALLCGIATGGSGTRLLANRFIPAIDGVVYVPGAVGHRALTASFIRRTTRIAAERNLACLFLHGHGRGDTVAFSTVDLASHERGYPALLDITNQVVGALVLASHAVAGDIWLPGGGRAEVATATVLADNVLTLTPARQHVAGHRHQDDRQARLFGDRGQAILRRSKVGVVGVGGAGMLAVEWLTRLGVGHLVVVDPDRVEVTNLTRLPGATRWDARALLTAPGRPQWMQTFGNRIATPKVRIARRLARHAGQGTTVTPFATDVRDPGAATALTDCDYLILAADTAIARQLVNVISHQYLIPAIQVGIKIPVDEAGTVGDLFAAVRPIRPDGGCLRCAGLIDPERLAVESLPDAQRRQADYGTGQPAPSVITLNAVAVSHTLTQMVFALSGLNQQPAVLHLRHHARRSAQVAGEVRRDRECPVCGTDGVVGLGDLLPLPLPGDPR